MSHGNVSEVEVLLFDVFGTIVENNVELKR